MPLEHVSDTARWVAIYRAMETERTDAFFRPFGWREGRHRSSGDEAHRLKREMKGMWFWRLLARLYPKRMQEEFRKMSGFVLLERGAPPA